MIINGKGRLNWWIEEGQLVFSGLADFRLSVITPAISNDPFIISSEDLPPLDDSVWTQMDYVRAGSSLTLSNIDGSLADLPDGSPGVLVLPTSWIRSGDANGSG